jgi:hypothetical protein
MTKDIPKIAASFDRILPRLAGAGNLNRGRLALLTKILKTQRSAYAAR